MRWLVAAVVLLMGALSATAFAQTPSMLRVIARRVPMDLYEIVNFNLQCPTGYIAAGYSNTPQYYYDDNELQANDLIDGTGAVINRAAVSSAAQLNGGGYALQIYNTEHHAKNMEAVVTCISQAVSTDNSFQLVRTDGSVTQGNNATLTSFCPAGAPTAFAGFSTAVGRLMIDQSSAPVWGSSAAPLPLLNVPDGTTTMPTGWQMRVYNNISSTPNFSVYAVCGNALPGAQTVVYSNSVPQGVFGFPTPFSVYAPVPDGWSAIGAGWDLSASAPVGIYAAVSYSAVDYWVDDGNVVDVLQWYNDTTGYDNNAGEIRAVIARGGGLAPTGPAPRAAAAVMVVPRSKADPPQTTVTVIEYYNASLDHYFITAIPDEITKLDNGTFVGWARTGQSFNAYGVGSSGGLAQRPVCREYGDPSVGLDSHFYSASPDECMQTLENSLGAWQLEASEVFEMDLPDSITGACPAGEIPVYRIWNQRRDSNHRYTTSTAIRDQMVALGGIAEGYGPNAVALCALP